MDIKTIVKRSIRLFKTATGPTKEEYDRILKITMLLTILLGTAGLLIHFILNIV